jgi:hypothetical protein
MTNYLKVDDRNRLLIMDRTFNKNRKIVGSKEYDLLQRAKADNPLYSVVLRHIKTNPEKQVYKHLTYDYMREYILCHPNSKERMAELEEMLLRAKCHAIRYPKVKEWFLGAYPNIDDFTPEQFHKENEENAVESNDYEVVMEAAA